MTISDFLKMCKDLKEGAVVDELDLDHITKLRADYNTLRKFNTQLHQAKASVASKLEYLHTDKIATIEVIAKLCESLGANPFVVTGTTDKTAEAIQQRSWEGLVLTGMILAQLNELARLHYLPFLHTKLIDAEIFMDTVYRIRDRLEELAQSRDQRAQANVMEVGALQLQLQPV